MRRARYEVARHGRADVAGLGRVAHDKGLGGGTAGLAGGHDRRRDQVLAAGRLCGRGGGHRRSQERGAYCRCYGDAFHHDAFLRERGTREVESRAAPARARDAGRLWFCQFFALRLLKHSAGGITSLNAQTALTPRLTQDAGGTSKIRDPVPTQHRDRQACPRRSRRRVKTYPS
jgi:hypothetical protein